MISTFDIFNLSAVAAVALSLGYAVFWALTVRKALAIRVYKKQALGIALLASTLASTDVVNTLSAYLVYGNPLQAQNQGGYGLFFIFLLALFYWVDASVIAARRSDPLSRDTFHWSRLRIALWIWSIPAPVLVIPFSVFFLFSAGGRFSSPPPAGLGVILFPGIFIPLISGVVVLPIISRRTADPILRRHLKWFGFFAAAILLFSIGLGSTPNGMLGLSFVYIGHILGAYCLYRSALSLTPLKPPLASRARTSLETSEPKDPTVQNLAAYSTPPVL